MNSLGCDAFSPLYCDLSTGNYYVHLSMNYLAETEELAFSIGMLSTGAPTIITNEVYTGEIIPFEVIDQKWKAIYELQVIQVQPDHHIGILNYSDIKPFIEGGTLH